jgi:hypothetical protein
MIRINLYSLVSPVNQIDVFRRLLHQRYLRKAEVMGKILSIQRGETPAHLPVLQCDHLTILPEENIHVHINVCRAK